MKYFLFIGVVVVILSYAGYLGFTSELISVNFKSVSRPTSSPCTCGLSPIRRKMPRWDRRENPVTSPAAASFSEEAVIDTVREPLIVLDDALRVVAAGRSSTTPS